MIFWITALLILLSTPSIRADSFDLRLLRLKEKNVAVASIHLKSGGAELQLYWKKEDGTALKTFEELRTWLERKSKKLLFAANGGIYRDSPSFAPIGLHVENGKSLMRLSMARNCGNFCWYSGVFLIENNLALILPRENAVTRDFSKSRLAFQSGPLLMRSGTLEGSWSRSSYNLNRSAVCTTARAGQVLFALVTDSTNFYEFFEVLKEAGCRDALFLDGNVSSFYDGRSRVRFGNPFESYAGILAVTESPIR
jgi:uncharacterized protein YigE (DUF2233 family)